MPQMSADYLGLLALTGAVMAIWLSTAEMLGRDA